MGESSYEWPKRQKVSATQYKSVNTVCEDCGRKWTATLAEVPVTIFIKDLDDYYSKLSKNLLEAVEPPMVLCVFTPSDRDSWDTEITLSCVAPRQDTPYNWRINHKHSGPAATSGCMIIPWRDKSFEIKSEEDIEDIEEIEDIEDLEDIVIIKEEIKDEVNEEIPEEIYSDTLADAKPVTDAVADSEQQQIMQQLRQQHIQKPSKLQYQQQEQQLHFQQQQQQQGGSVDPGSSVSGGQQQVQHLEQQSLLSGTGPGGLVSLILLRPPMYRQQQVIGEPSVQPLINSTFETQQRNKHPYKQQLTFFQQQQQHQQMQKQQNQMSSGTFILESQQRNQNPQRQQLAAVQQQQQKQKTQVLYISNQKPYLKDLKKKRSDEPQRSENLVVPFSTAMTLLQQQQPHQKQLKQLLAESYQESYLKHLENKTIAEPQKQLTANIRSNNVAQQQAGTSQQLNIQYPNNSEENKKLWENTDVNQLVSKEYKETSMKLVTWNEFKCFCGRPSNWYDCMMECQRCKHWFHETCVGCLRYKLICGDRFYLYLCEFCNNGREFLVRLPINWEDIAHLSLWNLFHLKHKIAKNAKYFEYEEQIAPWVNNHWDLLQCPPELQSIRIGDRTVHILLALQGNSNKFKCGTEVRKKKSIWSLKDPSNPLSVVEIILPPEIPFTVALMHKISFCERTKGLPPIPKTFKVDAA